MNTTTLAEVLRAVRVSVVAEACGLTPKAIYKWMERGSLPRTEFTGETNYAERIARSSGGRYSASEIRRISKQQVAA
ncbi:Cro/Cl family transcriptional regulator [Serratia proteamaculans]|uniref:Cro/Cl family transcriptional regulator n=1 Tax=Serratia proteamaculans TaxID=28151 RepID=UPI00101ECA45|nr:Cro/Cl family transcriptional regulator [Serratia proteamaculans]RYM47368.1 Cro/Cl family transcriptional regulator [Serratia proteamaculans]RYM55627.1 Cro/Cl family transcriptional regulator [Serratia proteamaculans]